MTSPLKASNSIKVMSPKKKSSDVAVAVEVNSKDITADTKDKSSPVKNPAKAEVIAGKKDKGKGFTPTDWTASAKEEQSSFTHAADVGASRDQELLPEEEDDSFYLESEDLGSESSLYDDEDSLDGQDGYDEQDSFVEGDEEASSSSIQLQQGRSPKSADPISLENEVDDLLKEMEENAGYGRDGGDLEGIELVQPGTLRSGKRKRDFVVEEYAPESAFHDDLTIVGRGISGGGSGSSSKR